MKIINGVRNVMKNIKTPYAFLNKGLGQNVYSTQSLFNTYKISETGILFIVEFHMSISCIF